MSLKEQYENLCKKWTPEVGDNPDNFWFYSAWYAVKTILACNGHDIKKVNPFIHQSLCMSHGNWNVFLKCLEEYAPKFPEEPLRPYYSDHRPEQDFPGRARRIFEHQFRNHFKGKRMNSKFANEKWEEVRGAALELAKKELEREHAEWGVRERHRNKLFDERWQAWCKECVEIEEARRPLAFLCGKEVACSPASKSSA